MPISSQRSGRDERAALYPPELLPVFSQSFITSFDLFDEYVARLALGIYQTLGLDRICANEVTVAESMDKAGLDSAAALAPTSWILATLASRGWIDRIVAADGQSRYRGRSTLPMLETGEILEKQRQHDPACLPSYEIADMAAMHYPAVLRGAASGEQALFGPEGIVPWVRYFSNENPLYAVSNKVGAVAAAGLPVAVHEKILEIGAGLGSGADSLLGELLCNGGESRALSYHLTEISPLFLKRARRNLSAKHGNTNLVFAELDIDRPFPAQIVAPGSFSLVYGVNVLHVARDLAATLADLRQALRSDGMLVMAECVRPFRNVPLPIELVFNLLESFRNPVLVPQWRPNGGFLTPEQWTAALSANGFTDVRIFPDIASIRDDYPNFMIAAIVARRT
ncbi:MAG TPA: class I SAM-dependent methyltransferase [Burkholderiales bacterium]|nr:class I SAM-dependent methyltransferase [Burkholderiales bacterium]